jgi:hypothetical protein
MYRAILFLALAALISSARATEDRTLLDHCKAMVEQAKASTPESAELRRCKRVIIEWTLRDSRMSVDENGRPLR